MGEQVLGRPSGQEPTKFPRDKGWHTEAPWGSSSSLRPRLSFMAKDRPLDGAGPGGGACVEEGPLFPEEERLGFLQRLAPAP